MKTDYDYIFKILIIGNSFVGKTKLLNCYIKNSKETTSTIGLDFYTQRTNIDEKHIRIQFWDTAGQERYKSIISSYYYGAQGAFVLYDITDEKSFSDIDFWINDLKEKCDKIIIVIIGNKSDLKEKRKIKKEDGEKKAKKFDAYFFEISSLCKENVDTVFEFMINNVYENNKNIYDEDEIEIINKNKCCY